MTAVNGASGATATLDLGGQPGPLTLLLDGVQSAADCGRAARLFTAC
jgi:hypothetical protein